MNIHRTSKIIISASRRTDVPAFYMSWFMRRIQSGFFEVTNPFNHKVKQVPATPDRVHTIVFWSKNFGLFLDKGHGEQLLKQGYHLFFNFTINSGCNILEPHVPPLNKRLDQLENLCRRFGPQTITWRFDPICFFKTDAGRLQDNLYDFSAIAAKAAEYGIVRCVTSFMDHYAKIDRRVAARPGFEFIEPGKEKKIEILHQMDKTLSTTNIRLSICCEKDLLDGSSPSSPLTGSACIPGHLIQQFFGGRLTLKKDAGQRIKAGCGCTQSADIGSYRLQPCFHNCLFCYANPSAGAATKTEIVDSASKETAC